MRYRLLSLFFIFLCSCGPTVIRTGPQENIRSIAILPIASESEIPREKLQYLHSALVRELDGSGYIVLSPDVVLDICSSSDCPEKANLASAFGIQTFARLDIESERRANFIAGYYNNISGTLSLINPENQKLLSVEHSQSEHGGVIFNSGQVIQAIRSSVDNYGDQKFTALADEFIRTIVMQLPKSDTEDADRSLRIDSVSIALKEQARYELCISGAPSARAEITIGPRRLPLRETAKGHYCGIYPLGWLVTEEAEARAELRSAFGASVVKNVDLMNIGVCDPKEALNFENGIISRLCEKNDCTAKPRCSAAKFLIFSLDDKTGSYSRLGEAFGNKLKKLSPAFAVVAVQPDGSSSLPVFYGQKHE